MTIKKSTILFDFLCASSFMHAGVLFDTLVQTSDGFKKMQELSAGDQVISVDTDFLQHSKSITTIEDRELDFREH